MKKIILLLVAVVFILIFTACNEVLVVEQNSENSQQNELSSEEKVLGILKRQIVMFEHGNNGLPFDINKKNKGLVGWAFASVFAEQEGVPFGADGGRQELLALMHKEWLGFEVADDYYFSDVSESGDDIYIDVVSKDIGEDRAVVTVARTRNGLEMLDARYTFTRHKASDELLSSKASVLAYEGYIWRYETVEILADETEYPVVTIKTAEELIDLCERVNNHESDAVLGTFVLAGDIDLSGYQWQPMGVSYPNEIWDNAYTYAKVPGGFNGSFDGNGYTIKGVSVIDGKDEADVGFFGVIGTRARVYKLNIEGFIDDGGMARTQNATTGGFVGKVVGGAEVVDCSFSGTINGYCYVGGFAGAIRPLLLSPEYKATPTIANCKSNVQMKATYFSGGFVGNSYAKLTNCEANGTLTINAVTGTIPSSIGGFAGELVADISNCHSNMVVEYAIDGANRMGSFVGELLNCNITNCTISKNAVHDGWYLVGMKWYKTSVVEIEKIS